jgi:hypothetical protein
MLIGKSQSEDNLGIIDRMTAIEKNFNDTVKDAQDKKDYIIDKILIIVCYLRNTTYTYMLLLAIIVLI